jgi:hypothetical protein
MNLITPLLVLFASVLCGLAEAKATSGHGDVGLYILQQAIRFGCDPIKTNGLPTLTNSWSFSEDSHGRGVVILLNKESYAVTEAFLEKAFGSPNTRFKMPSDGSSDGVGYHSASKGGSIQLSRGESGAQVAIFRKMEKLAGSSPDVQANKTPGTAEPMFTRALHLDSSVLNQIRSQVPQKSGEASQAFLLRYFKTKQIEFKSPAFLKFDEPSGRLTIKTTEVDLDKIERLLFKPEDKK